jgi:hypothetical protein
VNLAATIRAATTTVAAISAVLKIAPASRVVSNHVVPRSAGSIIARQRLRIMPVPPRLWRPRKNPSFCLANLSPNIVASPWPRPLLQLLSRNLTRRNLKSKKQFLAHPET